MGHFLYEEKEDAFKFNKNSEMESILALNKSFDTLNKSSHRCRLCLNFIFFMLPLDVSQLINYLVLKKVSKIPTFYLLKIVQ